MIQLLLIFLLFYFFVTNYYFVQIFFPANLIKRKGRNHCDYSKIELEKSIAALPTQTLNKVSDLSVSFIEVEIREFLHKYLEK